MDSRGREYTDHQKNVRFNIEWILANVIPVLCLDLSILMNIAKWIYYFLVIRTHRKIRWEELYVEIIDCKVEDDYNLPSN